MLKFNKQYYFVKPVDLTECDTEYEVYSAEGLFMGTTILGVNPIFFNDKAERNAFEEFLLDETMGIQAQVKFLKEYRVPIEEVSSLNQSVEVICRTMDSQWGIPYSVMERYLAQYL